MKDIRKDNLGIGGEESGLWLGIDGSSNDTSVCTNMVVINMLYKIGYLL